LTEHVRIALKRETSNRYAGSSRLLNALLVHPELEEHLRQSVHVTNTGSQLAVAPEYSERVMSAIHACLEQQMDKLPVLLCSLDVRCHLRKMIEVEFFDLPVMSFQELAPDLKVIQMGQVNA
jgi:type III secretion protein V